MAHPVQNGAKKLSTGLTRGLSTVRLSALSIIGFSVVLNSSALGGQVQTAGRARMTARRLVRGPKQPETIPSRQISARALTDAGQRPATGAHQLPAVSRDLWRLQTLTGAIGLDMRTATGAAWPNIFQTAPTITALVSERTRKCAPHTFMPAYEGRPVAAGGGMQMHAVVRGNSGQRRTSAALRVTWRPARDGGAANGLPVSRPGVGRRRRHVSPDVAAPAGHIRGPAPRRAGQRILRAADGPGR